MDKISTLMPDLVSLGVVTLFETHGDYKFSFAAAISNQLLIMDKLQGQKKERPFTDLLLKKGDNTDLRALYEKATKKGWISGWAELRPR